MTTLDDDDDDKSSTKLDRRMHLVKEKEKNYSKGLLVTGVRPLYSR